MIILAVIFAILALLSVYGEFRYGIQYHPFALKQSSLYFLFEFLFCTVAALAFTLAHREEIEEEKEKREKKGDEPPSSTLPLS